jgi:hypothetical protein
MDSSRKWNLVRVKILPTRFTLGLVGKITKDILDGVEDIFDASVEREV